MTTDFGEKRTLFMHTMGINIEIAPDVKLGITVIHRGSGKDFNVIVTGKL